MKSPADKKFRTAQKLIDDFAGKLLALHDGKKIPTHWNVYLKAALAPRPQTAGRKINPAKVQQIAKALTLERESVIKPRTKHHNPAATKDRIAQETSVSRKTVDRVNDSIGEYLSNDGSLSPDRKAAIEEGIAEALAHEVLKEEAAEAQSINQQQAHRIRK